MIVRDIFFMILKTKLLRMLFNGIKTHGNKSFQFFIAYYSTMLSTYRSLRIV